MNLNPFGIDKQRGKGPFQTLGDIKRLKSILSSILTFPSPVETWISIKTIMKSLAERIVGVDLIRRNYGLEKPRGGDYRKKKKEMMRFFVWRPKTKLAHRRKHLRYSTNCSTKLKSQSPQVLEIFRYERRPHSSNAIILGTPLLFSLSFVYARWII